MKIDTNKARELYPSHSISQTLSRYLEDVLQLTGVVDSGDAIALFACLTATTDKEDEKKIEIIKEVLTYEYVGQIDEAWEIIDNTINQEEEKEVSIIEGSLGL